MPVLKKRIEKAFLERSWIKTEFISLPDQRKRTVDRIYAVY
jgi:hypothetical protein